MKNMMIVISMSSWHQESTKHFQKISIQIKRDFIKWRKTLPTRAISTIQLCKELVQLIRFTIIKYLDKITIWILSKLTFKKELLEVDKANYNQKLKKINKNFWTYSILVMKIQALCFRIMIETIKIIKQKKSLTIVKVFIFLLRLFRITILHLKVTKDKSNKITNNTTKIINSMIWQNMMMINK